MALGAFPVGSTIECQFTTRFAGIPTTLVGGVVSVYKDGSVVQSIAGVTLTADFDSTTGLNFVAIDTTADRAFYTAGATFTLTLTAGTVGTDAVAGTTVDTFSLTSAVTPAITGTVAALSLISDAFALLNVFLPGESIPASDGQFGLRLLNRLLGQWSLQQLTIPATLRHVFDVVANQGGPDNPYTIGPGGDFDVVRPARAQIERAAALFSDEVTEMPVTPMLEQTWQALPTKSLTGALFSAFYYQPLYTTGLGAMHLWPVPTTTEYQLVLYLQQPLTAFARLDSVAIVPDGYEEALVNNLARQLAKPYGRELDSDLQDRATRSLALIKRSNVKPVYMTNWFAGSVPYDINIGE
jgi:hypothetical protein